MIYQIPIEPIPAQQVSFLAGTNLLTLRIKVMKNISGVFMDLLINNNEPLLLGFKPKLNSELLQYIPNAEILGLKKLFFKGEKSNIIDVDYNYFNRGINLYYEL